MEKVQPAWVDVESKDRIKPYHQFGHPTTPSSCTRAKIKAQNAFNATLAYAEQLRLG